MLKGSCVLSVSKCVDDNYKMSVNVNEALLKRCSKRVRMNGYDNGEF